MPQLGNTLSELFKRAGVKEDHDALKVILQNDAIFKAEIPQDVVQALEGNLMNEQIALTKLKPRMQAEILDGVDTHIVRVATELQLGDEVITAINSAKTTGAKAEAAIKAIKKIGDTKVTEAEKKGGKTPEETQRMIDELNAIKAKQAEKDAAHQQEMQRLAEEGKAKELETAMRFEAMKYADKMNLPAEFSVEERVDMALTRIKAGIAEGKYKVAADNGRLRLTDENGADAYDSSNRKLDFSALAEQRLAPVLKKAEQKETDLLGVKIDGKDNPANAAYQQQLLKLAQEQGAKIPV